MQRNELLIPRQKSIIVSADIETNKLSDLVKKTRRVEGIGGYKIGFELVLAEGFQRVVESIRNYSDLPIIYDHQKAGNDVPQMGEKFAQVCKTGGVDAIILLPFTSPETQRAWTQACQDAGLTVLVGGHMTHPKFLHKEGGYIADDAPERIYALAAEMGVSDFVVPGNKVEHVSTYRNLLEKLLGPGNFTLYSPGFITQGGEISEFAKVAGNRWHAIVGSAIYKASDITKKAEELTKYLTQ